MLRTCKPLLTDREGTQALEAAGDVQVLGTKSVCWLGVPLVNDGRAIGLIAVQSYTPDYLYTARDEELLSFVSLHIANALERRKANESLRQAYAELEQRVEARTSELAVTNRELRDQITVRERIEFKLKHEALHDTLTGLPNRSQLLATLSLSLSRYRQNGDHRFAVLFLDLDRFKVVNDSVGHLVGDELLKEAALRISRCVREPDTVARLGGDEFAIVIDQIHDSHDAVMVAERVIRSLSEPMRIAGKELYTSASIGIAISHERYRNPEELLRDADVAMYRAKAAGRQRFALFDEKLHEDALRQLELEGDLRRGLQRQEFVPYYQPIVRLDDGRIIGFEALMRWQHPERGTQAPASFLATAEESGTLEQIDWQIYEQVCDDIRVLAIADRYVTINVSPRHLRAADFDERLLYLLQDRGVSAKDLRLEVTEGALLENPEQVQSCLRRLRDAGVQTFLDDFGTGYSSLVLPAQLPAARHQDRPLLRRRAQEWRERRQHGDRARDLRARRFAGPGSRRRGRRNRGTAQPAAPARPDPGPGLSVRQARVAGRHQRALRCLTTTPWERREPRILREPRRRLVRPGLRPHCIPGCSSCIARAVGSRATCTFPLAAAWPACSDAAWRGVSAFPTTPAAMCSMSTSATTTSPCSGIAASTGAPASRRCSGRSAPGPTVTGSNTSVPWNCTWALMSSTAAGSGACAPCVPSVCRYRCGRCRARTPASASSRAAIAFSWRFPGPCSARCSVTAAT